jgi:hypothetical protein
MPGSKGFPTRFEFESSFLLFNIEHFRVAADSLRWRGHAVILSARGSSNN